MTKRRLFQLLTAICIGSSLHASYAIHDSLAHHIGKQNKRYNSFMVALDLLHQSEAKVLVETGTARFGHASFVGDGGSTILFGSWAAHHQAKLYSIDHSGWAIDQARMAALPYSEHIEFVCMDAVEFLKSFPEKIDFLYLDSLNTFDANDPFPAQQQCLEELHAAYPALKSSSIVMIDDCDLPCGGIGKLAGEFLLDEGWKLYHNGYQTIFVR